MNTLAEIKQIKEMFFTEYGAALSMAGNQMSVGIGKDASTKDFTIEVRTINDKLLSILPETYQDVKVNVQVIGKISAL
jgi:hypothetical protein